MMRIIFAVAIWLVVSATPAFAAQKPKGGHASKPPAASKTHAKTTVKTTVKSPTVKASKAVSPKAKPTTVKATKVKATKVKTTEVKTARTATTSAPAIGTLSPVQQKLQRNTNLAAKLRSRLPAGTDLMAAAAGFRNLGQFVATVNASYNHGLSFVELKHRVVDQGMSLGQASRDLR